MGLFSKDKKAISGKDKLLNHKLQRDRYKTLEDALYGEVNVGTLDTKISYITFANGREVRLISAYDNVIFASDNDRPVELTSFLFWTDLTNAQRAELITNAEGGLLTENLLQYALKYLPESVNTLKKALDDSTIEALQKLGDDFADYEEIRTELYMNGDILESLIGQGLAIEDLNKTLQKMKEQEQTFIKFLELGTLNLEKVQMNRVPGTIRDITTSKKRFITAAAEAGATIAAMERLSSGFRWVEILAQLLAYKEAQSITLKPLEGVVSLPTKVDTLYSYENLFTLTGALDGDISSLVSEVFEFSGDKDLAETLARENEVLEKQVKSCEDYLVNQLSDEHSTTFEGLSEETKMSIKSLLLVRREANEKRKKRLDYVYSLILNDIHSEKDDQLRKIIEDKLEGIERASDVLPEDEIDETTESDFSVPEEDQVFSYDDGNLVLGKDGNYVVQHESEAEIVVETPLSETAKLAAAKELAASLAKNARPVDLDLLEQHLERFSTKPRRPRPSINL